MNRILKKFLYIIYQPYKWIFLIPFILLNSVFFGIMAVVLSSLFNQRIGSYYGGVVWSRFNSLITPMIVRVEGKEHISENISYVIISNHLSIYDIFLIYGWLGIDIKWIMKKELRKVPGVGFGSRKVGHIFLDRSNSRIAVESLNEAKRKLVSGTSVVIFPEGTRSVNGKMGSYKRGAFKLALDLGLPILPLTLIGTNKILPTNTLDIFPGKVTMIIHEPIDISKYNEEHIKTLMDDARKVIEKSLPV
jgi:1-acyl-sn-glycerol-3-phosphate acyltransferase